MKDYLIEFLRALNESVPPPAGMKHCITLGKHDNSAWEDKLAINLAVDEGRYQTLLFEGDDLEKEPVIIARECAAVLEQILAPERAA